jgi:hypothetical protein
MLNGRYLQFIGLMYRVHVVRAAAIDLFERIQLAVATGRQLLPGHRHRFDSFPPFRQSESWRWDSRFNAAACYLVLTKPIPLPGPPLHRV